MNLQTLYKRTTTGAIQSWRIDVNGSTLVTTYGQVDGKQQTTSDTILVGKNLGKSNETTPEEQANLEAQAQHEKKQKKGYVLSIQDAAAGLVDETIIKGGVSPMLAHTYAAQSSKIKYPAYIQPKLDGHRCIAVVENNRATLWSRTRKRIMSMPHIIKELEQNCKNMTLDGELYVHSYRDKFEQLTSLIRPEYPKPGHEVVEYHVYDVIQDHPFRERTAYLKALRPSHPIHVVNTRQVQNEEEAMEAYADFVSQGYEGAMLRNAAGAYENKRSYNLIKVKTMQDSEFRIVDVYEGRGKMTGRGIFLCETKSGTQFGVKMAGPLDDLVKYLQNPNEYIGRQLTVQFQDLTADGIPRFPVGLRIREDV